MSGEKSVVLCAQKNAFKCRVSTYTLKNNGHTDLVNFFEEAFPLFASETNAILNRLLTVKLNTCFEAKFMKLVTKTEKGINESEEKDDTEKNDESVENKDTEIDENVENEYLIMYIQTPNRVIDLSRNIKRFYKRHISSVILEQISEKEAEGGSGWTLYEILSLTVNINKHQVFNGAKHIQLPDFIANKKAVINVKNTDNQCFKWAVLAALHPNVKKPNRVTNYVRFQNELNFRNITFPVTLNQLSKFEQQNETISVNVYAIEEEYDASTRKKEKIIVPIRIADEIQSNHIHLLWISSVDSDENYDELKNRDKLSLCEMVNDTDINSHYCFIKDLAKLVVSQCNSVKGKIWLCDRCLHYFYSDTKLKIHKIACEQKNTCKITLPKRHSMQRWISFNNFNRQLPIPFIVYADIESLLQVIPVDAPTGSEIPKGAYQKHFPISIGFYLHDLHNPKKSQYKTHTGTDCIEWFVKNLYELSVEIAYKLRYVAEKDMNKNEEKLFNEAVTCHICNEKFDSIDVKVRDHSHITGVFRGAAHNKCNLKYQDARFLPVVFHNLNYDSHFLIEQLASGFQGKIDIIPINNEHYISFTKEVDDSIVNPENSGKYYNEKMKIRFIDSFRFLNSSLEKLASYLPRDKLVITTNEWGDLTSEKFDLLCRKGVYPYDYMDSVVKLSETCLPAKDSFYNQLNDSQISDEDYNHAQRVWETFEIQNMKEYTNLYLKTDILLLADIFENFRISSITLYGLDPAHYHTTPGLSWDAMLKLTRVRLEVLTDIDMLLFVESGNKIEVISFSFQK